MISERELATRCNFFWNNALPHLKHVVIQANREVEPWIGELDQSKFESKGFRSDFVSEAAFGIFYEAHSRGIATKIIDEKTFKNSVRNAWKRVRLVNSEIKGRGSLNLVEKEISSELAQRMESYFKTFDGSTPIIYQPRFPGYGPLNSCYGDLLTPHSLYEIKNSKGNLRGADLRQVLTYSAMNTLSSKYETIGRLCVINFRKGKSYEFDLEELLQKAIPGNPQTFARKLVEFLDSRASAVDIA